MRDFNIFYNNNGNMHQVLLDEQQYNLFKYYLDLICNNNIKVLEEIFCNAQDRGD